MASDPAPYARHGKCALCGTVYENYGNNPDPVLPHAYQRVCDLCNADTVIPVRLRLLRLPWLERERTEAE